MPTSIRSAVFCAAALVAAACSTLPRVRSTKTQPIRVDRVLLETGDLDAGAAALEQRTGIALTARGRDREGAHYAFFALDDGTLLELHQRDGAPEMPTPVAWTVAAGNLDDLQLLLRWHGYGAGAPTEVQCTLDGGTSVGWSSLAIEQPAIDGAPRFVVWSRRTALDSGEASKPGAQLEGLVIYVDNPSRLRQLTRTLGLDVPVRMGRPGGPRVALTTPRGPVLLGGGAAPSATGKQGHGDTVGPGEPLRGGAVDDDTLQVQ